MVPATDDNESEKTKVLVRDQNSLLAEIKQAKAQEACLILIRGTPQGHRFFITQAETVLGRDPTADFSITDQGISRKHAKLTRKDDKIQLTDLGSSNGTFINDKKINPNEPVTLAKEDMIKLGGSILKFLPAGELEILFYGNLGSAANLDPMTKIYNKGYLTEALEAEFKRARALHLEFSLIFFDLDHFKKINDTYGHEAGDLVLKEMTNLVKTQHIRPKDIFARYGGEEFVVLLNNTNTKNAAEIGERIRAAIEAHSFIYEDKRLPVTSSVGISDMKADTESGQALLKAADKALYEAKGSGRNRVVISKT